MNKKSSNPNIKDSNNRSDSIRLTLLGKWGAPDEKPGWEIKADSIYYYDKDSAYPYFLKGDTFLVKFPDRDTATAFGKIYVIKDTLRIVQYYRDNLIISAYRYKK